MDPLLMLLDRLEAMVADAGHVPLTNRLILEEDRLLELVEEMRRQVPGSLQQAERITRDRDRIVAKARESADNIVQEARNYAEQLTKDSTISQRAEEEANRVQSEARAVAREIRESARQYADDVMAKVEANLAHALKVVKDGRGQLTTVPEGSPAAAAGDAIRDGAGTGRGQGGGAPKPAGAAAPPNRR